MSGMSYLLRWSMFGPVLSFRRLKCLRTVHGKLARRRKREGCDKTLTISFYSSPWRHVCISRFDAIQFQCLRCTTTGWEIPIAGASCRDMGWKRSLTKDFRDRHELVASVYPSQVRAAALDLAFTAEASFGPRDRHVDFFCRSEKQQNVVETKWKLLPWDDLINRWYIVSTCEYSALCSLRRYKTTTALQFAFLMNAGWSTPRRECKFGAWKWLQAGLWLQR